MKPLQRKLTVFTRIFNGSTPLGYDFGHVYTADRWQKNVEIPLGQFAATLFSEYINMASVM
jgi:hypothetical protein